MKKGFTLIELLAVIIILAVIALIATPIVLDVIEDSKKSAAMSATAMVKESAELYYAEEFMKNNGGFLSYECTFTKDGGCSEIKMNGERPDNGTITINKDGVVNGKIEFNGYTYFICNSNVVEEESSNCSVVDYTLIFGITDDGIITGFKISSTTAYLDIIPVVNADTLTDEAQSYLESKKLTIPEYVGDIKVTGIASNAFSSYDIEEVTLLSNEALTIQTNAFPTTLKKLRVSSCLEKSYSAYSDILELIERNCGSAKKIICKRANVDTLHTEKCERTDTGCYHAGYSSGTIITYGNKTTEAKKLNSGDAFDCDVNGNGNYGECDSTTGICSERFYYISDYYNTSTKSFESNTAVLVFYSNSYVGEINYNTKGPYNADNINYLGPVDAIDLLPTTVQWPNVSLVSTIRNITNELDGATSGINNSIYTLPSEFDYEGHSARLLTAQEINAGCNATVGTRTDLELETCNYLLEKTNYVNSVNGNLGHWIENPVSNKTFAFVVDYTSSSMAYAYPNNSTQYGVRPAIEVAKENMEY